MKDYNTNHNRIYKFINFTVTFRFLLKRKRFLLQKTNHGVRPPAKEKKEIVDTLKAVERNRFLLQKTNHGVRPLAKKIIDTLKVVERNRL